MAINFPSSPAVNDTLAVGTDTWKWNGTTWEVQPIVSPSFNDVTVSGSVIGNTQGTHTGAVVGNATTATTATTLQTARSINGVSFNGSQNITVPSAAGTLTGSALSATVIQSNLTSVGTLTTLTVTNNITANANVVITQTPQLPTHATNKRYTDSRAIAFSVALS
jgi:hypothetical protein